MSEPSFGFVAIEGRGPTLSHPIGTEGHLLYHGFYYLGGKTKRRQCGCPLCHRCGDDVQRGFLGGAGHARADAEVSLLPTLAQNPPARAFLLPKFGCVGIDCVLVMFYI